MLRQLQYWWAHKAIRPVRVVFGCCLVQLMFSITLFVLTFLWSHFTADLGKSVYIEPRDYTPLYMFHRVVSGSSGSLIFVFSVVLLYTIIAMKQRVRVVAIVVFAVAVFFAVFAIIAVVVAYIFRATQECDSSFLCKPGNPVECASESAKAGKSAVVSTELCVGMMRAVELELGILALSLVLHVVTFTAGISVWRRWPEITSAEYTRSAEMYSSSLHSTTIMASPDDLWGDE